jgi:2-oxoglutarate dehydrogenase E2 component (dihydrolipoamide succinyltransferase)
VLRHGRSAGETVHVGEPLGHVEPASAEAMAAARAAATSAPVAAPVPVPAAKAPPPPPASPSAAAPAAPPPATPSAPARAAATTGPNGEPDDTPLSPAVRKLIVEHGLDPSNIYASGPGGRMLKEDVLRHLANAPKAAAPAPAVPAGASTPTAAASPSAAVQPSATSPPAAAPPSAPAGPTPAPATAPAPSAFVSDEERVVPMSRIRQRIAERLVRAQHTAAILTTFNQVDMSAVLELRARHKEAFEKKHGVKLGFMSLFGRSVVLALAEIPELNAEIRGTDIVYRERVHLGIAVGTERGLVVPVVKRAESLSIAELEREVGRLAAKAREGTLTIDELSGGTFSISNGGVYGSLLSTPILNPPQSGILGMHMIEKRAVVVNDAIVIRPMMYVALSYDHRIVDGEQAVTFLRRVKERLEDPERMLLEV